MILLRNWEILAVLLAREIHYNPNWTIQTEIKDLTLIQCTESKPIEQIRFPKFLNSKYIKQEFIKKFKFTEFEKNFRF